MDDASGTYGLEAGAPWTNPIDGSFDRGRCAFDRPQVFRLSGTYDFPFQQNILTKGWQMSGNLLAQTGPPFNAVIGFDQSGNTVGGQRPNLVMAADRSQHPHSCTVDQPGRILLARARTLGNLQRDFLSGPGIVNFDFSLIKDTPIHEQTHLQFRAEFFNLFNHANFGVPNANVFLQGLNGGASINPTFGQITNTSTSSRQIQFALKLMF